MEMQQSDGKRSRRDFLAATAGTVVGLTSRALPASPRNNAAMADHVILFWMSGGLSQLDTWDPKPGRPTAGEFRAIRTSVNGILLAEIFPRLAQQMKHVALIRSLTSSHDDHSAASYHLQTGHNPSPHLEHPGIGSVVVSQKRSLGTLPAYITINGLGPTAGYLGPESEAHFINQIHDREKPAELERYGNNDFGRSSLLARQLIEKGVRFVQVNRGGFDTHSNHFPMMRVHAEVIDPALAALIEDLAASGLLSRTLVLVLSEFGRTPWINPQGGRDHHAAVFSCLLAGGGVRGGQVIGSSDSDGVLPKEHPVTVPELHASVHHALGIDATKQVQTPLRRWRKPVDGGEPVGELF